MKVGRRIDLPRMHVAGSYVLSLPARPHRERHERDLTTIRLVFMGMPEPAYRRYRRRVNRINSALTAPRKVGMPDLTYPPNKTGRARPALRGRTVLLRLCDGFRSCSYA